MPNGKSKPKFFYGYVITAAGFIIWVTGWGTSPTFGVFFKPMLNEFGWSRAETALVYSMSIIVQAILAIGMGWLTDRLGPRKVMLVFGSFLGLGYIMMSQVNALWQFFLFYSLIASIGFSTINVPIMSTVSRWFVKKRATMIGIIQAGGSIGGLILAPLVGWLIIAHGWRTSYVILGIIVWLGILLSGYFLKREPRDTGQLPDGANAVTELGETNAVLKNVGFSLRKAGRTRQFWMIAGLFLALGFCRTTFLTHTAAHVQDLGFSLADGALVVAVLNGSTIIGRLTIGRIVGAIGTRRAYIIAFLISATSLGWGLVTDSLWGLYLFALAFGTGWGAQSVLRFALSSEVFGLTSLGLVFGILGLFESAAGSLGTYFGGFLFDRLGTYNPIFIAGIAITLFGAIISWQLKPGVKMN